MRGRRPKPSALKLIEGNPGKRPINSREPKPALSIPTCPAHLSPTAKAEWKRLARMLHDIGIISQLDRATLAAYCQAYGRWVEAERKLKETTVLLKTPAGYVQPSPWLAIANKNLELIHKFIGELGLSPASRSRVSAMPSLRSPGSSGWTAVWALSRRMTLQSAISAEGEEMARPCHQPDPTLRRQVEAMAGYGVPEADIARVIGIDPKTLRKHYRYELDSGHVKANMKVAENLYRKATGEGREAVTAAIFWLKTRARWKETAVHELGGAAGLPPVAVTQIRRVIVDPRERSNPDS